MGWNGQAENVFDILVRKLDSSYRDKVANLFVLKGDKNRAMKFDPSLKAQVARDEFNQGNFDRAIRLDSSLRSDVGAHYKRLADQETGQKKIALLEKAAKYGVSCKKDIGQEYLKMAIDNAGTNTGVSYAQQAMDYVSREDIFRFDVAHFTKLNSHLGEPKKIELSQNEWHKVADDISPGDKFRWLALSGFKAKCEGGIGSERSSDPLHAMSDLVDKTWIKNGRSTPLWLKKDQEPVTVYFWIERKKD
jgi:hypothetical protein